jgi:hypothetical protein
MAHFAELDASNIVQRVIVVNNEKLTDQHGVEHEHLGIDFCHRLFGSDTRWVQTSYNSNFRGTYAGIGFVYDPVQDIFKQPER